MEIMEMTWKMKTLSWKIERNSLKKVSGMPPDTFLFDFFLIFWLFVAHPQVDFEVRALCVVLGSYCFSELRLGFSCTSVVCHRQAGLWSEYPGSLGKVLEN